MLVLNIISKTRKSNWNQDGKELKLKPDKISKNPTGSYFSKSKNRNQRKTQTENQKKYPNIEINYK